MKLEGYSIPKVDNSDLQDEVHFPEQDSDPVNFLEDH